MFFTLFILLTDTDLHNVIKKGNILKDIHKRYIMYQVRYFSLINYYKVDYRWKTVVTSPEEDTEES